MAEKRKNKQFIRRAILLICIALFAVALIYFDIPKGLKEIVLGNPLIPKDFGRTQDLDIAFFDVGQGDSGLIGCEGKYILIDAGENGKGYTVLRYLDKLKVKKIDVMILTHPHSDHIGGADVIIENIGVERLYMPGTVTATASFEGVVDAVNEKDIGIIIPEVGDVLEVGGMSVAFLHPPASKEFANMNDVSIVVKIENHFGSALFAGDAEKEAEEDILATGMDINADVLKVPHHGSSTSSSQDFLDEVSPDIAIISCGANNDFGHPHREAVDLLSDSGAEVYITYEKGNIYISLGESGTEVTCER